MAWAHAPSSMLPKHSQKLLLLQWRSAHLSGGLRSYLFLADFADLTRPLSGYLSGNQLSVKASTAA